jgi:3-oxoacyl-[acyl-carrier-protein] synthase II
VGHSLADYLTTAGPVDVPDAAPNALGQLDPDRSRRFDEAAAIVALSTERMLAAASLEPAAVGLTIGTAFGAVQRSVQFVERVVRRGARFASPAEFPHLVPSAPSGNASIYTGARGPVMAVSDLTAGAEAATCVADALMHLGVTDAVVSGAVAPMDPLVTAVLGPICSERWGPRAGDGAGWVLIEVEEAARRRGAEVLADLAFLDSGAEPRRLLAAVPAPGKRALVALACAGDDDPTEWEGSPWVAVARRSVERHAGWHDALGGVALAAAAAAVARGDADEILVWSRRATHWYAALLRQPATVRPVGR